MLLVQPNCKIKKKFKITWDFTTFFIITYRRFNAIASQLKMHYFSEGAFESLIASQLLKKEKYIWSY